MDNHLTSTLTSRFLFQTQAGFHYHHWRFTVSHLSNSGIKGQNVGETMVLIGWEF
ncbi:MAG: acyloxyacyl hydrolase [Gammaproteobacteria bacterium]|nr:acyloxyacyl hydrolase [Gammaproteobacteria bacterium]